jgi:hypothetical protein
VAGYGVGLPSFIRDDVHECRNIKLEDKKVFIRSNYVYLEGGAGVEVF